MDNRFYHRGAIRDAADFVGRDREVEQILGLLRNGQSVSLIGPRRIGKSSLLLHLCREHVRRPFQLGPDKAIFTFIDSQEVAGAPAEEIYELLMDELMETIFRAGIDVNPPRNGGHYRSIDRLISQVSRNGIQVVILWDEFELLAANELLTPYFFARLRGLTSKYGLAFLTASQRPLFAITADEEILSSPFFNIFVSLTLGVWTKEESLELFRRRLDGSDIQFAPDYIEKMIALVGNHPFFLNMAGYHAFQSIVETGELSWESVQTEVELEALGHLSYIWQNLKQDERYSLAILEGPIDTMRLLEQQWLIESASDKNRSDFCYTNDILERFIRRQSVPGIIQAAPFIIDNYKRTVMIDSTLINLTVFQYNLLVRLAENRGKVVPAESLEEAVWGESLVDDPDRLKTLIKRLRKAIEPYQNWIASERGVGYSLREPDDNSNGN